MNKGGTQTVAGIKATMVHAVHSCGIMEDDGSIVYGGEACGYVLELPGGVKLYHAGDTAVFGDMADHSRPLCARDWPCCPSAITSPWIRAKPLTPADCCKPKSVIPMHFGTFPPLVGRPSHLKELLGAGGPEVIEMQPGQTLQ